MKTPSFDLSKDTKLNMSQLNKHNISIISTKKPQSLNALPRE